MKRSTFNYIKDILRDYPHIDKYIKDRMEELSVPHREDDLNSDIKGNLKRDAMANLMITIEQDRRLSALERNKRVISDNLRDCDEDTRVIIIELYTKKYAVHTMQSLINNRLIFCSRSQAHKLRNNFFNNVANDLGLDK